MLFRCAISVVFVFAGWSGAQGYLVSEVAIEYSAGSGANQAVTVLDFGDDSYAFEYRWDGSATGIDMILALDAAGPLEVTTQDFGFGLFVDTITYESLVMGGGYPTNWIGYFISTDGEVWTESTLGASDRALTDGDWDGWARQFSDPFPDPLASIPQTPLALTVPEPTSLLLMTGALGLLLRRRRRT